MTMSKFIVEFTNEAGAPNDPAHRNQELEAETLEMATTKVAELLKGTAIDGAVIYAPRAVLKAERRVHIAEIAPTGSVPRTAGAVVLDRYNPNPIPNVET